LNDTVEQVIELVFYGKEFHLISIYNGEGGRNIQIFVTSEKDSSNLIEQEL